MGTKAISQRENRMTVDDDGRTEIEEYLGKLEGEAWKALARTQYEKSRSEGRTHEEAFVDTLDKIIEVGDRTLRKIDDL